MDTYDSRLIPLYILFELNEKWAYSNEDEWLFERQGPTMEEIDEISKRQAKKKIFQSILTNKKTT